MSPRLLIHIGTEKTGTTTIQRFCQANRSKLLADGILYSRALGKHNHKLLSGAFLPIEKRRDYCPDADPRKALGKFMREVRRVVPEIALVSSEQFSSRFRLEQIQALKDWTDECGFSCELIIYLRRQDDFLISSYSTAVKGSCKKPLSADMAIKNKRRYDYLALLTAWTASFPRANVRIFEREQLHQGELLPDFCQALGVALRQRNYALPAKRNASLTPDLLQYKCVENQAIWSDDCDLASAHRASQALVAKLERITSPFAGYSLLSAPERARILDYYAFSNTIVAQKYLDRDGPLFSSPVETDSPVFSGCDDARLASIGAAVRADRTLVDRVHSLFGGAW